MARLTDTFLRSRRPPSIPRLRLLSRNSVEYPRPINARHQQTPPATANNQRGILHWLVCACALETPSIPNSDDPEVRALLYKMINLEGELGRLLGKLVLFKKLDEYARQQFMSDLIKRSRNQTNDSSKDVGPSEGVSNVNQAVEQQGPLNSDQKSNETENVGLSEGVSNVNQAAEQQGPLISDQTSNETKNLGPSEGVSNVNQAVEQQRPLISDQTSNETENVGPSEGVSDVQAVQQQQPLISDPTNDDSELIVSADQDSGESSALRFRYGEPFPLDVENESVTVTGRHMHLEPPREPSPLFVEYKDRRASLELHRDDSGELFIVRRIRVEQIWMELHETAPSGFDDPPSYVNVPPEPEPEPSAAGGSYRCGEPFPNNVRCETATVTAHRVHREAAPPGVAGQFLLFVEA
ncbi:hypothetical protein L6164_029044 [Bauhinia variegata]|uniref:Uncharacterized protein n=1 Tax=Bauhinia variegata TaxID=167791 RepID=A0ACB9L897_BAUVA|nr:hypothetical protein L6164_029044 [Bauhinia variegata]